MNDSNAAQAVTQVSWLNYRVWPKVAIVGERLLGKAAYRVTGRAAYRSASISASDFCVKEIQRLSYLDSWSAYSEMTKDGKNQCQ